MPRIFRTTLGASLVVLTCLIAVTTTTTARPAYLDDRRPGDDPRSILWEPKQAAFEKLQAALALPPTAERASQDDYDANYYDIDIAIDEGPETVAGSVTMLGTSTVDGLTTVILDLYDNMTVDSVAHDGVSASYSHSSDRINVSLNSTVNTGGQFEVSVTYHGAPVDDALNFSTHNTVPIISSLSEPIGARQWWPCKDTPADKADSARIALTVNDAYIAVSNGMLVSEVDNGSTKTYTWFESYPITTYLISVAITNYSSFTDYYTHPGGSMPIENYVYPEHYSNAIEDLNITADAIDILSQIFGEYPFINERYGHAIFPWGGAMEHQTCTSYGRVLIRGDHYYDWILVHELGHQWWGDWVTCDTWEDIWLNEGFASYSEAVYFEDLGGESGYDDYVDGYDSHGYFDGPIYDPWTTFSRTVYDKGALVLHMLRRVLALQDGVVDHYPIDRLQSALAEYGATYAYDSATTAELQTILESHYGGSLDWFFLPWIYGENRPDYEWSWIAGNHGPPYGVMLHVDQVQSNAGLFTMPIDIKIHTTAGDTIVVAWNDQLNQDFFFEVGAPVTDVTFDDGNWILKYSNEVAPTGIEEGDVPATLALGAPTELVGGGVSLSFSMPTAGHAEVAMFDIAGRRVATLVDRETPAGTHEAIWNGTGAGGEPVASGIYFARLTTAAEFASRKVLLVR